jgi:hypothetical protein
MQLLLILLSLHSAFAITEGEPMPATRCDQSRVHACENEHRAAEQTCRSSLPPFQLREETLAGELADLEISRSAMESALVNESTNKAAAETELEFVHSEDSGSLTEPLFPSAPALEKIFFKNNFSQKWREHYSDQRALKLQGQISDSAGRIAVLRSNYDLISNKIADVTKSRQNALAEINTFLRDIKIHAAMWSGGCSSQICAGR